jgi:hypothetical protein
MTAKVLKKLFVFKEVSCGVWGVSLVRERFFGLHETMCSGLNLSSYMLKAHEVMRCITLIQIIEQMINFQGQGYTRPLDHMTWSNKNST